MFVLELRLAFFICNLFTLFGLGVWGGQEGDGVLYMYKHALGSLKMFYIFILSEIQSQKRK